MVNDKLLIRRILSEQLNINRSVFERITHLENRIASLETYIEHLKSVRQNVQVISHQTREKGAISRTDSLRTRKGVKKGKKTS